MRPVMCSALARDAGAAAAATAMTAIKASHGAVSEVRHTGRCCADASEASQQVNENAMTASRLLIDCDGSLISGLMSSKGAANAIRHVAVDAIAGEIDARADVRLPMAGVATAICESIEPKTWTRDG